jgi:CBS domain-containing protein
MRIRLQASQKLWLCGENMPIDYLIKSMIELKISSFVVSDENNYILGIITSEDLLGYLLELLNTNYVSKKINLESVYWDQSFTEI